MIRRTLLAVGLVAIAAAGCASDGPDRGDVLADLADDVVVPGYVSLAADAGALADAATDLCAAPSEESVTAARDAMAATRSSWLSTEAFWIGPVMDRRSWAKVDWPIAPDEVEALIADPSVVVDAELLGQRVGADQRGLQAVEYLLGPPDEPPVAALGDERRCDYLVGLTTVIEAEAEGIAAEWTGAGEDGAPYRERFRDVGEGSLDTLVNDALFLTEAITDAGLGRALGLMGDDADPTAAPEGPAGLGVADLASRTAGLRATLIGPDGDGGIGPLLSDDLVSRLREVFDRADGALARLDGPLRDRLHDQAATLVEFRDALKEAQVLVTTEVVGALGVTIGFSDADGDSG